MAEIEAKTIDTGSGPATIFRLDTLIDQEDESKFIALMEGQFIGCVGLRYRKRRSACFRQLFVREDYRSRSVGSALVHRCIEIARAEGCESIAANIDVENRDVFPFYERLGFAFIYEFEENGDLLISLKLR